MQLDRWAGRFSHTSDRGICGLLIDRSCERKRTEPNTCRLRLHRSADGPCHETWTMVGGWRTSLDTRERRGLCVAKLACLDLSMIERHAP